MRYLKTLVTGLAVTMIIGLIVLVALFVMRFPQASAPWPDQIVLPDGARPQAVTRGPGWIAVVTEGGRIVILSPDGARVVQEIEVETAGQ